MNYAELKAIINITDVPQSRKCSECENVAVAKGRCNRCNLRLGVLRKNPDHEFKRPAKKLTIGTETKTIAEWSLEYGIHDGTIRSRLEKGWSHEDAVKTRPRYRVDQHNRQPISNFGAGRK